MQFISKDKSADCWVKPQGRPHKADRFILDVFISQEMFLLHMFLSS